MSIVISIIMRKFSYCIKSNLINFAMLKNKTKLVMQVISNADCKKTPYGDEIKSQMLCASVPKGGKDACQVIILHPIQDGLMFFGLHRGMGRLLDLISENLTDIRAEYLKWLYFCMMPIMI